MAATDLKKLRQGHVYHCEVSTRLLATTCKCLGTEESSWEFLEGMLCHFCLGADAVLKHANTGQH